MRVECNMVINDHGPLWRSPLLKEAVIIIIIIINTTTPPESESCCKGRKCVDVKVGKNNEKSLLL